MVENLKAEGEVSKRYRVTYGGERVADCDTAQEAWDAKQEYERLIRPVTGSGKKFRYQYFDGRQELDIQQFRARVKAEQDKLR